MLFKQLNYDFILYDSSLLFSKEYRICKSLCFCDKTRYCVQNKLQTSVTRIIALTHVEMLK